MSAGLQEGEQYEFEDRGQRWIGSWHPSAAEPAGRRHGSAGICLTETGEVVLVSADVVSWDFPAGRPEGDESWEQTLHREMLEEACAVVTDARLLGFSRGHCVQGVEAGLVLVRSIWLARVRLLDWNPRSEIRHRCLVSPGKAISRVPIIYRPIWNHAFVKAAGAPVSGNQ